MAVPVVVARLHPLLNGEYAIDSDSLMHHKDK
jgi:hypothetical protein